MYQVIVLPIVSVAVLALIALILTFVGVFGGENQGTVGTWTVAEINAKYITTPAIRVYRVKVDFDDGEVTLRGSVNDEAARLEAERLALEVPTVESVRNEIRIEPRAISEDLSDLVDGRLKERTGGAVPDAVDEPEVLTAEESNDLDDAIRAEIRRLREEKGDPSNDKIQISVSNGVITIRGEVKSRLQIVHGRILARDIPGVREVIMDVEVAE